MLASHKLLSGMYSASRSLTQQLGRLFVFVLLTLKFLFVLLVILVCVYAHLTGSAASALLLLEVVVFSF